jgi:hypothetical protein
MWPRTVKTPEFTLNAVRWRRRSGWRYRGRVFAIGVCRVNERPLTSSARQRSIALGPNLIRKSSNNKTQQ